MKKKVALAVSIAIIAIVSSSAIVGYDYWSQHRQLDTSWVEAANNLLKNYNLNTNETWNTNPEVTLSYLNLNLIENGTSHLLYYGNGDTLSRYLVDLLKEANIQKGTITQTHLEEILAANKVLSLNYRLSVLSPSAKYYAGYFILKDNLLY